MTVAGMAALVLSACGADGRSKKPGVKPRRISYGSGAQQFGELHLPRDGVAPKGVVVVIHGGFWLAQYTSSLGSPLADSLAEHGWAAWNIEYRRAGDGGGDPATMNDIAAAIDKIADLGLSAETLKTVVALGHSAGGQLAGFAASRSRFPAWSPTRIELTHVIAQAGVMDLSAAYRADLGDGAVQNFLGHAPDASDRRIDPLSQVPLTQPVWCVHGDADTNVPLSQSKSYVAAATSAGATVELVRVPGDHFALITTTSAAWRRILTIFDSIA
jgi:acetyl esterase/lipase